MTVVSDASVPGSRGTAADPPEADRPSAKRIEGVLLGGALGDALGLPFEGLPAPRVGRHFDPRRFQLLGRTGFVSDDTEQSGLLAEALCRSRSPTEAERHLRRALAGWFLRLPFGVGGGTARACVRMVFGARSPGSRSAGNGAAMRAPILGVACEDEHREELTRRLASLTHRDVRAVEGALFVAEVTAALARDEAPLAALRDARRVLSHPAMEAAVDHALLLAAEDVDLEEAAGALGATGYVVCSVGLCSFCLARFGASLDAVHAAIRAGGDTDTHAAIVGSWVGARHGPGAFPACLVDAIHDGPFGPTHLRALASALARRTSPPTYSRLAALLRNLALFPVVLGHVVLRSWFWRSGAAPARRFVP